MLVLLRQSCPCAFPLFRHCHVGHSERHGPRPKRPAATAGCAPGLASPQHTEAVGPQYRASIGITPGMAGRQAVFIASNQHWSRGGAMRRDISLESWRGKRVRLSLRLKAEEGAQAWTGLEIVKTDRNGITPANQSNIASGDGWEAHHLSWRFWITPPRSPFWPGFVVRDAFGWIASRWKRWDATCRQRRRGGYSTRHRLAVIVLTFFTASTDFPAKTEVSHAHSCSRRFLHFRNFRQRSRGGPCP